MPNLVVLHQMVLTQRKTPNTGNAGAPPLGMGGVVDCKKHAPMLNVVLLKGVTINRGESLKLGSAGALPPWDAVWLTHENKSPPCMCYHFGRSASNKGVGINRRESPKLGSAGARPLGWDAWLTPRNMPLPHVLSCRTWSFCVKGSGYK